MIEELIEAAHRIGEFRLHPLGFFYLQYELGNGARRRIPVWVPDAGDRPDNDRHQHSFDIELLVVAGKMQSEVYRFRQTEEGSELEFEVVYEADKSILQPTGRRGELDPIASFETGAGHRYKLAAGVVHRVIVTEVPCITILTVIERGKPIYSYGFPGEQPFVRRPPDANEASRIGAIIAAVGSRGRGK